MNLIDYYSVEKFQDKVNVPIALVADSNYLPFASATIESIIAHATNNYIYHIILLYTDICDQEAIDVLKHQCLKHDNFSFQSLSILDFITKNIGNFSNSLDKMSHFTPAIYGRIIIPEILSFFDKVIYTDVDIIYQRDIAELMFMDMADKMIAAVPEVTTEVDRFVKDQKALRRLSSLNLSENETYINSGLLIFNIKKCLAKDFAKQVIHFISEKSLKFPDQDAINAICKSDIFYLSQAWNCTVDSSKFVEYIDILSANSNAYNLLNEWVEVSKKDTTCFHYMGGCKPWDVYYGFKVNLFWDYFKKSPFFVSYFSKMLTNQIPTHLNYSLNVKKIYYSIFGIPFGHFTLSAAERSFSFGKIKIYKTILNTNKEKIYIFGIRVLTKKYRNS